MEAPCALLFSSVGLCLHLLPAAEDIGQLGRDQSQLPFHELLGLCQKVPQSPIIWLEPKGGTSPHPEEGKDVPEEIALPSNKFS